MTDNTMREAMIDQGGAVWEEIGGAWSMYWPAQSVQVVGEPVEVFDSRCNYTSFAGRVCNKCGRIHDGGLGGMVGGEQVSKAEEKAAEADELRKDAELEQLAEQWEHRARRRFKEAEGEKDPMGRRLVENGAMCYFNAAQELREVLKKKA